MAEGLPKLPGYRFTDITQRQFQKIKKFDFKNGYAFPLLDGFGIGKKELDVNSVAYIQKEDPVRYDPSLTYGRSRSIALPQFVPFFAQYSNKCLTFRAFFKQGIYESPIEYYRVRYVNIIYFLEDNTIQIMEPPINNTGIPQGKFLKRCQIPKNDHGQFYHWKDLNVGMDLTVFGTVFHIIDADAFTREYMSSQGIDINPREDEPPDPYLQERLMATTTPIRKTPQVDDKLRRFLEFDGKVLRFDCVWDDRDSELGEMRGHILYYFLADDTISVKEARERNDGRDPFPKMLRRVKVPKNWKHQPSTYPACCMELSDAEVTEYYQPKDLLIGETIFIYGRRFLLTDCDKFTRNYYQKMLNIVQKSRIEWKPPCPLIVQRQIPPHVSKLGSLEDSLGFSFKLVPKQPKDDIIKQLYNQGKILKYLAKMVTAHPEDTIREFVIMYDLSDSKIKIMEPPIRNSGIWGGKFLQKELIPKPNTPDNDCPEYYTPADFYIGAQIIIHNHVFKIIGADLFVYRYIEKNKEKFSQHVIENIRNYMFQEGLLKDDIQQQMEENEEQKKIQDICKIDQNIEIPKNDVEICKEKLQSSNSTFNNNSGKQIDDNSPYIQRKDPIEVPSQKMYGIQDPVLDCRYPKYMEKSPSSTTCNVRAEPPIPCCLKSDCPQNLNTKDTDNERKQLYYDSLLKREKHICQNHESSILVPCAKDTNDKIICKNICSSNIDNKDNIKKTVQFSENPLIDPCIDDIDRPTFEKKICDCTNYNYL